MAEGTQHTDDIDPVLVIIPTYNERDNLPPLVRRLHTVLPQVHVLVVDDGSPDGTGEVADKLAADDDRIHVLHRTEKAGLGAAYIAGFRWALERDYATVVEMDADGSHAPEDLPRVLDALSDADLVIGSRYVPGGALVNWPLHRQLLSRMANLYSKIALGVPVSDITAGFRAYRRGVLETLPLGAIASQGYCFQIDLTWRTDEEGFRILEVPITFTERELGQSKMSGAIIGEALVKVAQWGLHRRTEQARSLLGTLLRRVRR
ncbi:polyprenol monophosphomannose synthase [Saccharomonospora viridis]|jgi:dolichol-phosphate mannosyltransferase|uniref:Glycosyl transferase n=2 Tax=Saccharomonospora viridis TaxID=1852 RepID=C7MWT2_SACVD|nr:polyprenol monophosphomannose synthase [Saccharomonospora viridis]ACU97186.1 glycosyl transferase [Saccharomonospora viridis DSM 43017]KHF43447.1 dolichol-phosphate mannosyltransferase [Saccharomonospora viridis]SFO78990.1 dolichol-phosphate mannosyltransferase [Saccharomonospora viridis]